MSLPAYLDSITATLNKAHNKLQLQEKPQLQEQTLTNVNLFLQKWSALGLKPTEGSVVPEQIKFLADFVVKNNIKNILEVGFNAGLSAGTFLASSPKTRVISLDIGAHEYVLKAQSALAHQYPGRLFLVIGDSGDTLHQFQTYHPEYRPDLIFLDGGHTYPTPSIDLAFALKIVKVGGWIIIDDVFTKGREPDVLKAVQEAVKGGKMVLLGQYEAQDRGWVVAKPIY